MCGEATTTPCSVSFASISAASKYGFTPGKLATTFSMPSASGRFTATISTLGLARNAGMWLRVAHQPAPMTPILTLSFKLSSQWRRSSGAFSQVIVDDLAGDESEIGAPVEGFERLDHRQAKHRRLGVGAQFDRRGPTPAFV